MSTRHDIHRIMEASERGSHTRLDLPYAVYGTLRTGFGNDVLWQGRATSLGMATVAGFRLVSNGGFPYALPADETIVVELILPPFADDEALALRSALDGLEGYPSFYDRIMVETTMWDAPEAWLYTPVQPERYSQLRVVRENDWSLA